MLLNLRRALVITIALGSAMLTGSAQAQDSNSYLYLAHAASGRNISAGTNPEVPIDVSVNGNCIAGGLSFAEIRGPFAIQAGDCCLSRQQGKCGKSMQRTGGLHSDILPWRRLSPTWGFFRSTTPTTSLVRLYPLNSDANCRRPYAGHCDQCDTSELERHHYVRPKNGWKWRSIPCTGGHYANGYASPRVGLLVNLFDRDKYSPGWASQHSDFETECVRLCFGRIHCQWIGAATRPKNSMGCVLRVSTFESSAGIARPSLGRS